MKELRRFFIFTLLAIAVLSAIVLTVLVHYIPVAKTDVVLSREVQGIGGGFVLFLMRAISIWGDSWVSTMSVVTAAIIFIAYQYQREALFLLLTFFTDSLSILVKTLIARPRPGADLVAVYEDFGGYSFPSTHVVHYVVFFGFLFAIMVNRKSIPFFVRVAISLFSLFLILGISVSRVYLGAHWASDVIGGYIFGFIMLSIMLRAYLWFTAKVSQPHV